LTPQTVRSWLFDWLDTLVSRPDGLPDALWAIWWVDHQNRTVLLLTVLCFAGLLVYRLTHIGSPTNTPRQDERMVRRPTNTPRLQRWWWNLHPPRDLMRVDGLAIDRTRKPHCAWLGPTGAGKSASVATVRLDGARATLIGTPDLSDPLVASVARLAGFRWTACVSDVPVNFLIGTPTEVAERLTEVFRSGGVGAWKRAARRATADVIRDLDGAGTPRTLVAIGEGLETATRTDRELRTVCAGWVSRFLDLADQFGASIGPDGVDLADLLRAGQTVLLDNDSFDHPSLGGDVVALCLAEAKRCASLVPSGFRLIFEEAGQLGERVDLAEPFLRAGRRRSITVDLLTQAESDLKSDGISANVSTRIYFSQELRSLQRVASDRLGLKPEDLDPAAMKDFTAWVAHGRIRRLIHFPKPPKTRPVAPFSREATTSTQAPVKRGGRKRVVPIELTRPVLSMLPPPSITMEKYLEKTYREDGCLRWTGKHDKNGYGYIYIEADGASVLVHRWRWEMAYGPIGRDPVTGGRLTVDHRASCHKDCSDLAHLEVCTRSENSKRRWRTDGVSRGTARRQAS